MALTVRDQKISIKPRTPPKQKRHVSLAHHVVGGNGKRVWPAGALGIVCGHVDARGKSGA